jgi:SAM-dependent methyltransferase
LPAAPRYDFVLLVHVIEHLPSPRHALERIHAMLRPGGGLYVECPNLAAPHAAPGKQFHYAHIHNFTPQTLELLAQRCGFEIVARLAPSRARALRLVLRRLDRTPDSGSATIPGSFAATCDRLKKNSLVGYYLRPSYWFDRVHRDLRFVSHHVCPRWRLARILRSCHQPSVSSAIPPRPIAGPTSEQPRPASVSPG